MDVSVILLVFIPLLIVVALLSFIAGQEIEARKHMDIWFRGWKAAKDSFDLPRKENPE